MKIDIKPDSPLALKHPDLTVNERAFGTVIEIDDEKYNHFRSEANKAVPYLSEEDKNIWAIYNAHKHPGHLPSDAMEPMAEKGGLREQSFLARQLEEATQLRDAFSGHTEAIVSSGKQTSEKLDEHTEALKSMTGIICTAIGTEHAKSMANIDQHVSEISETYRTIRLVREVREESDRMRFAENLKWEWIFRILILVVLMGILGVLAAKAEPGNVVNPSTVIHSILLRPTPIFAQVSGNTIARMQFLSGGSWVSVSSAAPLPITCLSGCSGGGGGGGTSSNFGDPFPTDGTAAGFIDASGNMAGGTLDAGGRLIVTGAGGTFPVTGTFWQATQPVSGTFFQATQPVSGPLTDTQLRATAVPVSLASAPTTSVTQGTSPWITAGGGTAGTAASGVATIQGIASMTPVQVSQATAASLNATVVGTGTFVAQVTGTVTANAGTNLNTSLLELDSTGAALNLAQASTTSGQTGPLVQTATTTAAPSYTTAKTNPLSTDTSGNLRVAGAVTGSGNFTVVQPTGTNLHAVLDTTSTTAVTQATAANLNAAVVGTGTAGSAAGGILTVQGVASMTKLLVTPDSVALPANQSVNVAQLAGTTTDTNSGNKSAGTLRVVLATDQPTMTNAQPVTLGAETTKVIGTVRNVGNVGAIFDGATGAAPPANVLYMGGINSGATGGFLGGIPVCDTFVNVNISTNTTTLLITGVSGRHIRVCSYDLQNNAADNVGIISGTGATCGTGSAAIVGTTAATGYNFAANGGISKGTGIGTVMRTVATGDSICLITSAATQLSGNWSYVIY